MTGKTHITAGIVTSLAIGANAPQIALIAFGSLLPDVDHAGSTFGKAVKPISKRLRHRGFTHSILFLIITTIISPYLGMGVLTHILLDLMNPKGVELLYPHKKNYKIPLISRFAKTDSVFEHILFFFLVVAGVAILIFYEDLWGFKNLFEYTSLWFNS